jgi:hypothetical protein
VFDDLGPEAGIDAAILLPASMPWGGGRDIGEVFTLWLSMMDALGWVCGRTCCVPTRSGRS